MAWSAKKKCLISGWHSRQKKIQLGLRETYIHRILGERLFDKHIWKFDIDSLAGGLSIGLFIALTPTIPFQMFLSAVCAILLKVNLPIALVACWITNPFTALPIYLTAHQLGEFLLEGSRLAEFIFDLFDFETRTGKFMRQGLYLWVGSVIFAFVFALFGNITIRLAGLMIHRLKDKLPASDD